MSSGTPRILEHQSRELAALENKSDSTRLVCHLGVRARDDHVAFGFWFPDLDRRIGNPILEIMRPRQPAESWFQTGSFSADRFLFEFRSSGAFHWLALGGVKVGDRLGWGDLYRVFQPAGQGRWRQFADPLAASLPFGSFGPAEVYSLERCQVDRADLEYLGALALKEPEKPAALLEIHPQTATASGTLAGLQRWIQDQRAGSGLSQGKTRNCPHLDGFDAIQLMPLEPVAEPRLLAEAWPSAPSVESLRTVVTRPRIINWGYDVLGVGFPAANPSLLESTRPHEVLDFIAALHTLPGQGLGVFLDLVLGHVHRQAARLLPSHFFAGPNRYGLNLNYSDPTVRAILLEMVRRKCQWGMDGIRFDATQDIQVQGPGSSRVHDDDFLRELGGLEAEIGSVRYRPLRVFEDTRPWPARSWRKRASFRSEIDAGNADLQWGPLCFPDFEKTLPECRADRVSHLTRSLREGGSWVSAGTTHDTYREENRRWGEDISVQASLSRKLFDPALTLLLYMAGPGVPVEFLNALDGRPWGFFRNADYPAQARDIRNEWGFAEQLIREGFVDLPGGLRCLQRGRGTAQALAELETAWIDQVFGLCARENPQLDAPLVCWLAELRTLRSQAPWLAAPLTDADQVWENLSPNRGILAVMRNAPAGDGQLLSVGVWDPKGVALWSCLEELKLESRQAWELLISTPGVDAREVRELKLRAGQAICLRRRAEHDGGGRR